MATKGGFSKGWKGFVDHKWIKERSALELAVGPRCSGVHLLATPLASLLSMHREPWRSGIGCVPASLQAGQKAGLHCESATSRTRKSREDATWKPSRRW